MTDATAVNAAAPPSPPRNTLREIPLGSLVLLITFLLRVFALRTYILEATFLYVNLITAERFEKWRSIKIATAIHPNIL